MADSISRERRSANMRKIRSTDTSPELAVRRLVHSLGYRFRLHRKDLPGKPDLVFPSRRKVIFVHGCFWHQHRNCIDGRVPKSRRDYWIAKLQRNVERDLQSQRRLRRAGWSVMTIWECQTKDPELLKQRITRFLEKQKDE